jgi:alpha-1,6-mannosyltransferase
MAVILAGGVLLTLLLTPAYPIGANDVFEYTAQGELLARHGLNPMVHTLDEFPDLPWFDHIVWLDHVSYYGPVWSWIEAGIVKVFGTADLVRLVIAFKLAAVSAYLVSCLLIVRILRDRAPRTVVSGLLMFAWNPLVLFEVAVNAHNDMLVGTLILAGVFFWQQRRLLWMLAMLTLAALVKAPAAVVLPLFAVAAWRSEPEYRRRQFLIQGGLVMLGVAGAAYLSLPEGLAGLSNLPKLGGFFTQSLPTVIKLSWQLFVPEAVARAAAFVAVLCLLGSLVLRQIRAINRTPAQAELHVFNALLFLLLLCIPWFQAWYLLWILPLAAVYPRPNAAFQVGLSTLCVTWAYIVYGFAWFWLFPIGNWGNNLVIQVVALVTTYVLPWIYAVHLIVTSKKRSLKPDLITT